MFFIVKKVFFSDFKCYCLTK